MTIAEQIKALKAQEFAVETNEGTYGEDDARRAIGSASPQFANYTIYERVDGQRRVVGCDPERAPGRARKLSTDALQEARKELAKLQKQATGR